MSKKFKRTAKEHVCILLENIYILNKFNSFELFTHQTILDKTLIVNMISEDHLSLKTEVMMLKIQLK